MRQIGSNEIDLLRRLEVRPLHHLQLTVDEQRRAERLWRRDFIVLHRGDFWLLTSKGKLLLECGGAVH